MFRIAVCDDSQKAMERTTSILQEYAAQRKLMNVRVVTYNGSFDLMDDIENGAEIHALIIETTMKGMSGMQVAMNLKKMHYNVPVIFLTSDRTHALEAYEVGAVQYLIKGKEKKNLFGALDQINDLDRNERRRKILLYARDGIYNIFMRDIMYVECDHNYQRISLEDGTDLEVRATVKELAARLELNSSFRRCGSSYIINWFYLKSMTSDHITMIDDTIIPVPRGKYGELRNCYEGFVGMLSSR